MEKINRRAMSVPRENLVDEIEKANRAKMDTLEQRNRDFGANRPHIGSYMENITLPGVFGFDMNDFYKDSRLAMDIELRTKLFWLDNSLDDSLASLYVGAGSMYYDMTLFGLHINYQTDGVPIFDRHALETDPDISQLKPFDFYSTGEMPIVHKRYGEMKRISEELYGGKVGVGFPHFHRGPLDIMIQLRGYENFVCDCAENPGYVHELMDYIIGERKRFNDLAADFRGEPAPKTTFIADDWLHIPFISPDIFDKFIVPAYLKIQKNEGAVTGFHTCGVFVPLIKKILGTFDAIKALDVSGWNDIDELDRIVDKDIFFHVAFINSFVILSPPKDHEARLRAVREIVRKRGLAVNVQAIVKILGSADDSIMAMNRFIELARRILSDQPTAQVLRQL